MGQTHAGAWGAPAAAHRVQGGVASRGARRRVGRAAAGSGDVTPPRGRHRRPARRPRRHLPADAAAPHRRRGGVRGRQARAAREAAGADAGGWRGDPGAAGRAGRVLMVGLVLRHWPEYERLHQLAGEGAIGTVRSASALRLSPPADWADWFIDPAQSGGVAVDLMVHDFDQLNALLGPARNGARAVRAAGPHGAPQHVVRGHVAPGAAAPRPRAGMMLPGSYPFTSGLRVLGERGLLEYPFVAERATRSPTTPRRPRCRSISTAPSRRSTRPATAGAPRSATSSTVWLPAPSRPTARSRRRGRRWRSRWRPSGRSRRASPRKFSSPAAAGTRPRRRLPAPLGRARSASVGVGGDDADRRRVVCRRSSRRVDSSSACVAAPARRDRDPNGPCAPPAHSAGPASSTTSDVVPRRRANASQGRRASRSGGALAVAPPAVWAWEPITLLGVDQPARHGRSAPGHGSGRWSGSSASSTCSS